MICGLPRTEVYILLIRFIKEHGGITIPCLRTCQGVYYLSPDHKTITRVIDDLVQPNGIVGTPDGKSLFVADIGGNKTWSYTINNDGSLGIKSCSVKWVPME